MAVTVSIGPELEARLAARARLTGQSLENFIQNLLEREVSQDETARELTGAEKAAAFRAWAESFPDELPVLSIDKITREKIYQRD